MSTQQPEQDAQADLRREIVRREQAEAALREEVALRQRAEASLRRSMEELCKVEALVHELQDKLGVPRSEFKDPLKDAIEAA